MNEQEETIGGETPEGASLVAESEPIPEPTPTPEPSPEPEIISGPPPADPSTYEVEKADPRQATAEEALENLRAGTETLKTHSAAKIPGSLIHDAVIPLEKAYRAFKTLMGK